MADVAAPSEPAGIGQKIAGPPIHRLTISQVTSFLILSQRRAVTVTGTLDQLRAHYRKVLLHNLLLGWWGFPFGVIWTVMALIRNSRALGRLDQLARGETLNA